MSDHANTEGFGYWRTRALAAEAERDRLLDAEQKWADETLLAIGREREAMGVLLSEAIESRDRLAAALKEIQQWDCLNPPKAELCADHPWLRRLVDAALAEVPEATPKEKP